MSTVSSVVNRPSTNDNRKKLLIVGDKGCGKKTLMSAFRRRTAPPSVSMDDGPLVEDVEVDGKTVQLQLLIAWGQSYSSMKKIPFQDTHVILVCFSIDNPGSLETVPEAWVMPIREVCPNVPIILVGNKIDRRVDKTVKTVTPQGGVEMAERISAVAYLECSAETKEGVMEVFDMATRATFDKLIEKERKKTLEKKKKKDKKKKKTRCVIM